MPKIYNQWDNNTIITKSGDKYQTIYAKSKNKETQEWEIYEKDIINIYEEIQEASEGSSLKEMIEKYGNPEIKEMTYADTSEIPTNKIEKYELKTSNENKINELKNKIQQLENENKGKTENEQK